MRKKLILFVLFVNAISIIFANEDNTQNKLDISKNKSIKNRYKRVNFEGIKSGHRPHLNIGASIGLTLNRYNYSKRTSEYDSDLGFGYQGGINFRVSKSRFLTQFDLNYVSTLVTISDYELIDDSIDNIRINMSIKYNSLSIPIVAGIYTVNKAVFKHRIYTGLNVFLLAKSKIFIEEFDTALNTYTSSSIKLSKSFKRAIFRNSQFTYIIGTGFDIGMFTLDFRYDLGLSNYFKDPENKRRTQSHLYQFTVGVVF